MSTKIFGLVVGAIVVLVMRTLARRRAALEDARGGCVACGSRRLRADGDSVVCEQCHYVGRADRGGKLSGAEIDALYSDAPPPRDKFAD